MELAIAGVIVFVASLVGLRASNTGARDAFEAKKNGYRLTIAENLAKIMNLISGFSFFASIVMIIAGALIYFNIL